ncbi:MAG: 50S ribosomal protein L9 [Cyanobacteria bacterium NC_groundwater_1444_Ag_S-0.65um_54_12]|nr:50S ribosomal protein L9 [Cyanobacteria bacterium NC_groundwater_1444_Ag_S-0.65um_54_12]
MKVILLSDVKGIGNSGQVMEVTSGYARNYLFPRGLAQEATAGALKQIAQRLRTEQIKAAKRKAEAEALAQKLEAAHVKIAARSGSEGKLYGAVTNKEIAQAVQEQTGLVVDRRKLDLAEPIKAIGKFAIVAKVHPEVAATLHVEVVGVGK